MLQVAYKPLVSGPDNEDGAIGLIGFDLTGVERVGERLEEFDQTATQVRTITEAAAEKNFASNISGKWEANPGRQECLVG